MSIVCICALQYWVQAVRSVFINSKHFLFNDFQFENVKCLHSAVNRFIFSSFSLSLSTTPSLPLSRSIYLSIALSQSFWFRQECRIDRIWLVMSYLLKSPSNILLWHSISNSLWATVAVWFECRKLPKTDRIYRIECHPKYHHHIESMLKFYYMFAFKSAKPFVANMNLKRPKQHHHHQIIVMWAFSLCAVQFFPSSSFAAATAAAADSCSSFTLYLTVKLIWENLARF